MSQDQKPPANQPQQLNIEIDEKEAEGTYSNLAFIIHSPAEFIIDFTCVVPGMQKAKVRSRIITTPQHAKVFLRALQDNINKYEQRYGEIKVDVNPDQQFGFNIPVKNEKIN
ncbi:MAG: DUF3467 domain-containing protein [Ignavibacteriaceae bacterium]|nr:DUF3467 domain-containing protein [Ignavibacteriaceae bacterium]